MKLATRVAVALFVVALWSGDGWAQTTTTLEAQPPTIDVPPWKTEVEARLVLRTTGADVLLTPTLTWFTNDGLAVAVEPSSPGARLEGPGTCVWKVRISELDKARVPGAVQFEVSFGVAGKPSPQRLYASVKLQAPAAAEKNIDVSIQGSFDALTENRSGVVGYLIATNSLDVPIDIKSIAILQSTAGGAKSLDEAKVAPAQFTVPERSSVTAPITLKAAARLTPGKHTVLFDVQAAWAQGGHSYERHVVVARDVTVGVFFESEILKALGVPSFLLLPGCLFIFTMQVLLTLGLYGVNRHSKPPELPVTSPGFWVIAVTYSGLFATLYAWATKTDYLTQYGSRDLRNVWLASIAIGFAVYSLIAFVTARRRRLCVPSSSDDQIETLRKMGRRHQGIMASPVKFKIKEVALTAFLIETIEDGQTKVWVTPQIGADWSDAGAQAAFVDLINARADATAIADALAAGKAGNIVAIHWIAAGSVPNPYHLDVLSITEYPEPEPMVTTVTV